VDMWILFSSESVILLTSERR